MAAVGTLARGIAHDFGNTISIIGGYASSMADSLLPNTRAHQDAIKILETSRHAREQTGHLLSIARASDSETPRKLHIVSLATVLEDATGLLGETLAEREILFEPAAKRRLALHVSADREQLIDVLMDLYLNAADAMTEGGTLSVNLSSRHIERPNIKLNPKAKKGQYVIVRVKDSGPGIPEDVIEHIFEPFFTTRESTAVKGLGLTVAQSTIQSWGGWIRVRSSHTAGTTFSIYLPKVDVPRSQSTSSISAGGTVLLIDDNEKDLREMSEILESSGFKVYTAKSPNSGLSLWRENAQKIDLAIIDLIMPNADGRDVIREISEKDPDVRLIITSGFSRDYVLGRVSQGGWLFVQKPIERDTLLSTVTKAMTHSTAR
jgi:two-component system cell cycle sensor histidine kinase/response regulator CckA